MTDFQPLTRASLNAFLEQPVEILKLPPGTEENCKNLGFFTVGRVFDAIHDSAKSSSEKPDFYAANFIPFLEALQKKQPHPILSEELGSKSVQEVLEMASRDLLERALIPLEASWYHEKGAIRQLPENEQKRSLTALILEDSRSLYSLMQILHRHSTIPALSEKAAYAFAHDLLTSLDLGPGMSKEEIAAYTDNPPQAFKEAFAELFTNKESAKGNFARIKDFLGPLSHTVMTTPINIVPSKTFDAWYEMPVSHLQLAPALLRIFARNDESLMIRDVINNAYRVVMADPGLLERNSDLLKLFRNAFETAEWPSDEDKKWPHELAAMIGKHNADAIYSVNMTGGLLAPLKIPRTRFAPETSGRVNEISLLSLALGTKEDIKSLLGLSEDSFRKLHDEILAPLGLTSGTHPFDIGGFSANPPPGFRTAYPEECKGLPDYVPPLEPPIQTGAAPAFKPIIPSATLEELYERPASRLNLTPDLLAELKTYGVDGSETIGSLIDRVHTAGAHAPGIRQLREAFEKAEWPPEFAGMVGKYDADTIRHINEIGRLLANVSMEKTIISETMSGNRRISLLYLVLASEEDIDDSLKIAVDRLYNDVLKPLGLRFGMSIEEIKEFTANPTPMFRRAYPDLFKGLPGDVASLEPPIQDLIGSADALNKEARHKAAHAITQVFPKLRLQKGDILHTPEAYGRTPAGNDKDGVSSGGSLIDPGAVYTMFSKETASQYVEALQDAFGKMSPLGRELQYAILLLPGDEWQSKIYISDAALAVFGKDEQSLAQAKALVDKHIEDAKKKGGELSA